MGPRIRKSKEAAYQPSGEIKRVIPLGGNKWAYLIDEKGKLLHMQRDSEAFVTRCKEVDDVMNGKVTRDLKELGWLDVIEKMGELA